MTSNSILLLFEINKSRLRNAQLERQKRGEKRGKIVQVQESQELIGSSCGLTFDAYVHSGYSDYKVHYKLINC